MELREFINNPNRLLKATKHLVCVFVTSMFFSPMAFALSEWTSITFLSAKYVNFAKRMQTIGHNHLVNNIIVHDNDGKSLRIYRTGEMGELVDLDLDELGLSPSDHVYESRVIRAVLAKTVASFAAKRYLEHWINAQA